MSRVSVEDRGDTYDPGKRYYARSGAFSASSWSADAAEALVRQMQATAQRAELGPLDQDPPCGCRAYDWQHTVSDCRGVQDNVVDYFRGSAPYRSGPSSKPGRS